MLNKVIISGGGTGGHIFPAIAVANEIKQRFPNCNILFIGALGKMEMEKVPQAGFEIVGLPIVGIQRKFTFKNLLVPFKLVLSILKSFRILSEFKPDIVLGFGGYASASILYAASITNIPTLIQEQNQFAGLTNKYLAKKVKVICTGFEGLDNVFPKEKIVFTGNPVRELIHKCNKLNRTNSLNHFKLNENKLTVLVIGGSLGAKTINESIFEGLANVSSNNINLIWQTGNYFFEKAKLKETESIKVFSFIKEMDIAYSGADIVISRAGALSIAELCILGKPVILIPSPNVAEDHQTHNALSLVNKNAALMIKDSESKMKLIDELILLSKNKTLQEQLAFNCKKLAQHDAVNKIVNEVIKLKN